MPCYVPTINDLVIIISALLLISQYFDARHQRLWEDLKNSLLKMNNDSFKNYETDEIIKESKKDWDDLLAYSEKVTRVHWSISWFFSLLSLCILFVLICSIAECPIVLSWIGGDGKTAGYNWEWLKYFYVVVSSGLLVTVVLVGNDLWKMKNELVDFNVKTKQFFSKYKIVESYSKAVGMNAKVVVKSTKIKK